jgi:hypothetical protein
MIIIKMGIPQPFSLRKGIQDQKTNLHKMFKETQNIVLHL